MINFNQMSESILHSRNVIFVTNTFRLGGAERQAFVLARRLRDDHGANVEFVGLIHPSEVKQGGDFELARLCDEASIPRHGFQWNWHPPWSEVGNVELGRDLLKLAGFLRRLRPDALMPFVTMPSQVCGIIWRITAARTSIWNQRDEGQWITRSFRQRLGAALTPQFVSNSTEGAAALVERLGVPPHQVQVIGNAIEEQVPTMSRRQVRDHWSLPDDGVVVCMLANLQLRKDHETLLRAWKRVVSSHTPGSSATLVLAGQDGGTKTRLVALCKELGIDNSVKFLGAVRLVPDLLNACDIAVLSTHREGVPNGILEPMAMSLPVIATDLPGTQEALGGNEWLVAPGDSDVFADKLIELVRDPQLRARLGADNRRRVAEGYNARTQAGKFADLLARSIR
jgi:glycosyltransferase involved in cell wall biosynthesis